MKQMIIEADDLAAGYNGRPTWRDANFSVQNGEFVAVLGPNGAGKTTLFRLLLGLSQPLAGGLRVFGERPRRGNPHIGYVPQRRPIDAEMNIAASELVRLGIVGHRWGMSLPARVRREQTQTRKALEAVDALELAERPLGALSGGELQRVFLAQALVGEPELLLLDEPLANLDIRREVNLVQLVRKVSRERHVAVLLIAHDINPLLPVLDRVIYVANGRVATGTPDEVVTTKRLSELYGAPVEVLHDSRGRVAVLGTEEATFHHE